MSHTTMQLINIVLGFLGVVAVIIPLVMWVIAGIQVILRKDLKEHKLLWILLLIFASPIGTLAYFFAEGRKKYGWITAGAYIGLFVILLVYGVMTFVALRISQ